MDATEQLLADLKALADLLKTKKSWIKHTFAKKPIGRLSRCVVACQATDPDAGCWCLMGAAERVTYGVGRLLPLTGYHRYSRLLAALEAYLPKRAGGWIPSYNDHKDTTHQRVLKLIAKTIKATEKEAKL